MSIKMGIRVSAVALSLVTALGFSGAVSAGATSCSLARPADPYLAVGDDVASNVSASCTQATHRQLELYLRRVIRFWPDVTVAVTRQNATTTFWSVHTQGCDKPNEEHNYKAKAKFTGLNDRDSSTVALVCS